MNIFFTNVRLSYDEVCVLLDCLSIAKADKWITLETDRKNVIPSSEDKPIDVSDKTLTLVLFCSRVISLRNSSHFRFISEFLFKFLFLRKN